MREMDVFLDNSILKNILIKQNLGKSNNCEQSLRNKIYSHTGQEKSELISTPIMLLEYISYRLLPLANNPNNNSFFEKILQTEPFDANIALKNLINFVTERLAVLECTDYKWLLGRLKFEENFRSPYGALIARILFYDNISNISTRERFLYELTIDECQGIDFKKHFGTPNDRHRLEMILAELSRFLTHKTFNISIARILHTFYLSIPDPSHSDVARQCSYSFDSVRQDRLDTQLIHFVCVGHKREGATYPVLAFSCEKLERLKKRCRAYLAFIRVLENKTNYKSNPESRGWVYQVNPNTGLISDGFEVETLFREK